MRLQTRECRSTCSVEIAHSRCATRATNRNCALEVLSELVCCLLRIEDPGGRGVDVPEQVRQTAGDTFINLVCGFVHEALGVTEVVGIGPEQLKHCNGSPGRPAKREGVRLSDHPEVMDDGVPDLPQKIQ